MIRFSKKENIPLKEVFGDEPKFTKWLASDGLEYIKQALNVELITEGTEVSPNNKFTVDILLSVDPQYTKGEPDKIVVENQYGVTDHHHFSKLITYAVTNEAKYAVWIAEDVHPEHKRTIDWLNTNTNDNINFYLFKAVVEKVGNQEHCFVLEPVCEPDDEKKVRMSSSNKKLNELKITQKKFWTNLSYKISEMNCPFNGRKGLPQHWYNIGVGSSQCHISICAISQDSKIRIELWIPDNKALYDKLFNQKEAVEKVIGHELIWDRKDDAKASSISFEFLHGFDIYDETKYDGYAIAIIDELKDHFYKFETILKKIK